jgi:aryl sulfotransferase
MNGEVFWSADERLEDAPMTAAPVERNIEREYRTLVSDNLRWRHFTSRPGDIFVCTPAKCGTTWMQTIVSSLLFADGRAPGPVTEIAPWIEARFETIEVVLARLEAQTHRRSVKTHTEADGIPWFPAASYIVVGRDGRDAFMSGLNHMRSMRPELMMRMANSAVDEGIEIGVPPPVDDVHKFFAWWLDSRMWFEHVASFWAHRHESNVLFVHFNDMTLNLDAEMRRVARFLGIEIDEARWPEQVERCTFASMKSRSAEIADFERAFVGGADSFLYRGTNGRWQGVLTADELALFEQRARKLLAPEAFAWTTKGGHIGR